MRQALKIHPRSSCDAVMRIDVDVRRPRPGSLMLHYFVTGRTADLRLPAAAAPRRADELWLHTCFEAFVRAPPEACYCELNVAPSLQWAAYRFGGYRSGMRIADEIEAPRLGACSGDSQYELQAVVDFEGIPELARDAPWRLGLSAVIEEASGRKSYWALAHPQGKPDFHHPDCFALTLPAPSPP